MTATQVNAELLRNLALIVDDEELMERALKAIKRLVKRKQEDETLMSKEEYFARLDKSLEQARQGKVTRKRPGETLTEMLQRSGML